MILNLTQHPATPEQVAQGLVDYTNRESLKWLLTIPERALTDDGWRLDDLLDDRVEDLVNIATHHQEKALDALPEGLRGIEHLVAVRDALSLRVLVGGAPILMERLIPALKREGCIPMHALSDLTSKHIRFMDAL